SCACDGPQLPIHAEHPASPSRCRCGPGLCLIEHLAVACRNQQTQWAHHAEGRFSPITRPAPQECTMRLFLELLEARCLPSTVTNLTDHDPGSLRDAIATTPSGGTVDFQPGLTGTIVLTTGELAINKDLTIVGPGADVITVSGNKASRVFDIGNYTTAISGLT